MPAYKPPPVSDRVHQFRIFMQILDTGSFVGAARALKIPPATVSVAIRMLESELGVRLLHRTTRQVGLTHDGQRFLPMARMIVGDLDEICHLFTNDEEVVAGKLHIRVPNRIVWRLIAPALPSFLQQHPELELRFSSSDRDPDPLGEDVNGVIRMGNVRDDSLVHKPLGQLDRVNCASPRYLATHAALQHPDELVQHWAIGYLLPSEARRAVWHFTGASGAAQSIPVRHRFAVDDMDSYLACAQAGIGLIQAPRIDARHLLASGELVEVLPDWPATPVAVTALYPHRHHQSRRLAAFLDWFGTLLDRAAA